jgi:hypothetical protein
MCRSCAPKRPGASASAAASGSASAEEHTGRRIADLPLWAFCVMAVYSIIPLIVGVYFAISITRQRLRSVKLLRHPPLPRGVPPLAVKLS